MKLRPASLAFIFGLVLAAAAAGQGGSAFDLSTLPSLSSRDLVVLPDARRNLQYRFLPDGPWLAFDRSLVLSASPGEERSYSIETREDPIGPRDPSGPRDPMGPRLSRTVLVDKRPPRPPVVAVDSGLYRATISLKLEASVGEVLRYALVDSTAPAVSFSDYRPSNPPRIDPPAAGSVSFVFLAYSVDSAGNESPIVRRTYRLAPAGLALDAPKGELPVLPITILPPADIGEARLVSFPGSAELSFPLPADGQLLAAVNPGTKLLAESDFLPLGVSSGRAALTFSCPPGWSGKLPVYMAMRDRKGFRISENSVTVELSDLPASLPPEPPALVTGMAGGPAFLVFPSYDGQIFVTLGTKGLVRYEGPLAVAGGSAEVAVSWQGIGAMGTRSEMRQLALPLRPPLPRIGLKGAGEGELYNSARRIEATREGVLRYELSTDGTIPREPDARSGLLGDGLIVDALDGEEISCVLRYRTFSDTSPVANADEGGLLRFTIDRKPPMPPVTSAEMPAFSSLPLSLGLSSPDATVWASVESGGKKSEAIRLEGPISLVGSAQGPVDYLIHAWAVDRAGNRSAEMKPIRVNVDIATFYVASSAGAAPGDGSRDRPFADLDEAIAVATAPASQRSTICIRGEVGFSGGMVLEKGRLVIKGGYDGAWQAVDGARASIAVSRAGDAGKPFIRLVDSDLALIGLDVSLASPGSGPFVSALRSRLSLEKSVLVESTAADFLAFDVDASRLSIKDAELVVGEASSATMVSARSSEVIVESSRIAARSAVKYYGAFSLTGGSLALKNSIIESAASMGTRLIAMEGASILADRIFLDVSGGPGFLVVGSFSRSTGTISNTRVRVAWKGGAGLFRISGTGPAFIHDSIYASTEKGKLRFFDSDAGAPLLRNSIFACIGDGGELSVSRIAPKAGDIVADCVYGFSSLVGGGLKIADVAGLNAFNAPARPAMPCLSEEPARIWAASPASSEAPFTLRSASTLVDAALRIPGYSIDYSGSSRPDRGASGKPDIGSDELHRP